MPTLYECRSGYPDIDAQRNLEGKTHYVDADTLKYHKSRVLYSRASDDGLLFAIVESYAVTSDGKKRAFRHVIFDVFGNVIDRPALEQGVNSQQKARELLYRAMAGLNAIALTENAIRKYERECKAEIEDLRKRMERKKAG